MDISPSDLRLWLDPYTFSSSRTTASASAAETSAVNSRREPYLQTDDLDASLRLLEGAYGRLETILGNLTTMEDLLNDGINRRNIDDEKRDSIFAQMRSLTAGIDQLVEQTRFDGKTVLDGRTVELVDSISGRTRSLELPDFRSYGLDGLGIARKVKGAFPQIFYDQDVLRRNEGSTLVGLDISEAREARVQPGRRELPDGDYLVEITYFGPNSTVKILSEDGNSTLASIPNVDLSGDGQELVDLGVGVELSFEKENGPDLDGEEFWDKYNYELLGPTTLYAKLNYTQLLKHNLYGRESEVVRKAELYNSERAEGINGRGSLSFGGAAMAPPEEGRDALGPGTYEIEVRYAGERSNILLRNEEGRVIDTIAGIDLSQPGVTNATFPSGPNIALLNASFNQGFTTIKSDLILSPENKESVRTAELLNSAAVSRADLFNVRDAVSEAGIGSVSIDTAAMGELAEGASPLEAGNYKVEVNFAGTSSTVSLRDRDGNEVDVVRNVDLSRDGTTTVEFPRGPKIDVINTGYRDATGFAVGDLVLSSDRRDQLGAPGPVEVSDNGGTVSFTSAAIAKVPPEEETLAPGDYTVEVAYLGQFSNALLRNDEGEIVKMLSAVDLTGPETTLDFGVGASVTLRNSGYEGSFAQLKTTLRMGVDQFPAEDVRAPYAVIIEPQNATRDDGSFLSLAAARLAGVVKGEQALEPGTYNIQVDYWGQSSSVWLRDQEGTLIDVIPSVDLSSDDFHELDFGNGVEIAVQNFGWGDEPTRINAKLEYFEPEQGADTIDFADYLRSVEAAREVVEEQMTILDDTFFELRQVQKLQDQINPARGGQAAVANTAGTSAIQMIASSVDSSMLNILLPEAATAQLSVSATTLLNTINSTDGSAGGPDLSVPGAGVLSLLNTSANISATSVSSLF